MDDWQRFAYCYDLDQGAFEEDLALYLNLARRTGSPILELGCGSGRLLLALAQAGYRVVGVDLLPAMLERARHNLGSAPPAVQERIRLLCNDILDLDLAERFALAILAVNTLMHLETAPRQAQALRRAFHHLAPDGLLVVDLFSPHPTLLAPAEGELLLDRVLVDPASGRPLLKFVARQADFAHQTITATFIYDLIEEDGRLVRTARSFPLRYLHRGEAEQMLRGAGFVIEGLYGSYDLDPYDDNAERMLFLARRPG